MIPRSLAAVLSSLISQLSLLVLLLHPSPVPHSLPLPYSTSDSNPTFPNSLLLSSLLIVHHFLSTSDIVTALHLLTTTGRKRKRTLHISEGPSDGLPLQVKTSDLSFHIHFNMSPSTFDWLFDLLEPLLDSQHPPIHHIPPKLRLSIALYRLATGSTFPEIARLFHVTGNAAKFCTKQLCRVLCNNFRFWVGFPTQSELKSVCRGFRDLTGLPSCCGAIDCVRFRVGNGVDGEQLVATQLVVDSNSRILSIAAGFRGEKSDYEILKSTSLYKDITSGELLSSAAADDGGVPRYLVGGGGSRYRLLPWLMVPFGDRSSPGSSEERFNSAVSRSRVPLLRTVASLKRWGVLSGDVVEGEVRDGVAYIGACAILHNALLMREDYSALCGELEKDPGVVKGFEQCGGGGDGNDGGAIREALKEMVKES